MKSDLIKLAAKLSKQAHSGQKDKANVDYYSGHIKTVVKRIKDKNYSDKYIVVAYLHDAIEDTSITYNNIKKTFGVEIADAVLAMTKKDNEDYSKYINRVMKNKIASTVKYYDMDHNTDLDRLDVVTDKDIARAKKYKKIMHKLRPIMEYKMKTLREFINERDVLSIKSVISFDKIMKNTKASEFDKKKSLSSAYNDIEKELIRIKDKYKKFLNKLISKKDKTKTKILVGIKSLDSVVSKSMKRGKPLKEMKDLVRAALLFETNEQAKDAYDTIVRKYSSMIVRKEEKKKGSDPVFGYFGSFHVIFKFEGLAVELQIMSKKLWNYKDTAHDFYNKYRDQKKPSPSKFDAHMSKLVFSKGNQPKYIKEDLDIIYSIIEELFEENS